MRVPPLRHKIPRLPPATTSQLLTLHFGAPAPERTPRPGSGSPGLGRVSGYCRTGSRLPVPVGPLEGVDVGFQVDLLVLHRPPKPLHEDVAGVPALPVHADLHSAVLEDLGEFPAGEPAPICLRLPRSRGGSAISVAARASMPPAGRRTIFTKRTDVAIPAVSSPGRGNTDVYELRPGRRRYRSPLPPAHRCAVCSQSAG